MTDTYNLDVLLRAKQQGMETFKQAENGLLGLGKAAIVAGAMLSGAAAAGVIAFGIAAVEKTTEAGQAAYQMSEKFGMATQSASEWLTVARHLGVDANQIGSGFKFLSKNVEALILIQHEHKKATAAMLQPYKDLGLHVRDAAGHIKSANELMLEAADRFAKMPDGIEKTGLAIKLFGKQGMEMLPVLNLGRKGLEDMMNAGKATGEVMSGPQVAAAHKMFLEQQKLNSIMVGFTMQVGNQLMPQALRLADWLTTKGAPGVVAFAKPFIAQLGPAITSFVGWLQTLGPLLQRGYDTFKAWAPAIIGVAAAWALWNVGLALTNALVMVGSIVRLGVMLITFVSQAGLARTAMLLLDLAMDANPIGLITLAIAALVAGVIWAYNNVKPFRDIVNALGGAFTAFAKQFWTDIKPIFDWIGGTLIPLVEKAVGLFNVLNQSNSGGSTAAQQKGMGGRGGVRPAATGFEGMVYKPTLFLAGEAGSEHVSITPRGKSPGGGMTINVTVMGHVSTERGIVQAIREGIRRADREMR
jgi:hypothetical protein